MKRQAQPLTPSGEQEPCPLDIPHRAGEGCYTVSDVCRLLQISKPTFRRQFRAGRLPFVQELLPRIGRPRFQVGPIQRYLTGDWNRRPFGVTHPPKRSA